MALTLRVTLSNKWAHDKGGIFGAVFMGAFAAIAAWRWLNTGSLFFALLLWRDLLVSYFFFIRRSSSRVNSGMPAMIAYISTLLPLCYQGPPDPPEVWQVVAANLLFIFGFLLATLATIELGDRMGVAPAIRGNLCTAGVYRWLKHPMYTGYIIAEIGWIFIWPWNGIPFLISFGFYVTRSMLEGTIFEEDE